VTLDAPAEEIKALVDVGDQGLLLRQAQAHRGQDPCDLLPEGFGVGLGAVHHQAPVVGEPDQPDVGQTATATLLPFQLPSAGTPGVLGDELVQDGEGHIAEQRGENRTLGGTGVVLPQHAVLAEDARLEERLDQGQDAFVSDTTAHPFE
jgi:hypothetical protein